MSKDFNRSGSSGHQRPGTHTGGTGSSQGGRQSGGQGGGQTSPGKTRDQEIGREFSPNKQGNQSGRSPNEQMRREKERNQPQ